MVMGLSAPGLPPPGAQGGGHMVTHGDADSCLAHGLHKCAPMSSFSAVELYLQ